MKPNSYKLIELCVENGALMGWQRAYKRSDTPSEHQVQAEIVAAIMLEVNEWFDFGDTE